MTVSEHGDAKRSRRRSRGTLEGSVRRGRSKPVNDDKRVADQDAVTLLKGEASSA
jgi:hypothetical protein